MGDCIFCKIVNKEAEASIVYEDDKTMAFMDIGAATPGHLLVVPKKHVETIYDMDEDTMCAVTKTVLRVSKAAKKALKPLGLNVLQNNESFAGQVIFHFHIHLLPRFEGDGVHSRFSYSHPPKQETDELAKKIKSAIE